MKACCDSRQREERHCSKATFSRAQTEESRNLLQRQHSLSHCHMKGLAIRISLLAGNLFLHRGKLADPTTNYMWAPSIPAMIGSRVLLVSQFDRGSMRLSVPVSEGTKDDDDSTWWLTHCLLSRARAPTQPPKSVPRSTRSYKHSSTNKEKECDTDQTEWAITRALVPRRFQRPASEHRPPVPGLPPARVP